MRVMVCFVAGLFLVCCGAPVEEVKMRPALVPEPSEAYSGLRKQILALSPGEIGLAESAEGGSVWGLLMETGYPAGVVTLVALADGTTSLYLGSGGGIIGAGEHEAVRSAARSFLSQAEGALGRFEATDDYPLPDVGEVRFYTLTFDGVLSAAEVEETLGAGEQPLSLLFFAGHEVIGELRVLEEARP